LRDVEGRVAFITGGSSGIGLGIARSFAEAGMKIVLGYRTQEHLENALGCLKSSGDRVHAIRVDVTDRAGMEQAAAETVRVFGRVHVIVNNAGVDFPAPIGYTTYDDWDWIMDVNVNGVFNGVRAFLPRIQAHGEGGQIISTSSVLGLVGGFGGGGYSASKSAVIGIMEALRAELLSTNVGVSVFCPGLVKSKVMDSIRNRPEHLSNTIFKDDPESRSREEQLRDDPCHVMDPFACGEIVLRGMRRNDLYILSHPEFEGLIRDRYDLIAASMPTGNSVTESRAEWARMMRQGSIYQR
jgi:NAD(P)-dependent dehydrogenase (short-subunit alcohol dehydrogenase family)